VLAQQIVAMVAMEPWAVDELYDQVRQAYPYRDLPRPVFSSVLEMIAGRYPSQTFSDLKPRISWDRVNNSLHSMPGSQRLAVINGGAIPDTGQFGVYLEDGSTRVGELDEEFVYETRVGDFFTLGTNTWRVTDIGSDRVAVVSSPGGPAQMPFWKGEYFSRDYELGKHFGAFCRQLGGRLDDSGCQDRLKRQCNLDTNAAFNLCQYLRDQREKGEIIPDDRTILIEGFRDEIGDMRLGLLSPFGGRLHLTWKLAILAQFRRQWQIQPESMHSDAGILFHLTLRDIGPAVEVIRSVRSDNLEELVVEELATSPLFGLRFRQNAARALLLPSRQPGRRTPLWLQRMKARDLLEVAQQCESFPIVVETYRECMQDFLEIEGLKELLTRIEAGEVKIAVREKLRPSPFISSLLFDFTATYLYDWDEPKAGAQITPAADQELLKELLQPEAVAGLLYDGAVKQMESRLQGKREGYKARTDTELVELLRRIGDLTREEITERVVEDAAETLNRLSTQHRILQIFIPGVEKSWRWITTEEYPLYRDAFSDPSAGPDSPESYQVLPVDTGDKKMPCPVVDLLPPELLQAPKDRGTAQKVILERFLKSHALTAGEDIRKRYPLDEGFVLGVLHGLETDGAVMQVQGVTDDGLVRWAFRDTVERIRRLTLTQQRRQVEPCDVSDYVDFLLRWQHRHPEARVSGQEGLLTVLGQLQGLPLPAQIIDGEILARRVEGYRSAWLNELCGRGNLAWYGSPSGSGEWGDISFAFRDELSHLRRGTAEAKDQQSDCEAIRILRDALSRKGASFLTDLVVETGLPPSQCAAALWNMIWSGQVTNDSFVVVRSGRPVRKGDENYHQRQSLRGLPRKGLHRQMAHLRGYRAIDGAGRWSLLPEPIQAEADVEEGRLEVLARQLLCRYGMLCRELYALEGRDLPWRLLYQTLVRLEWRGEIRRGFFVKGFSGGQFALPQAADQLTSYSREGPRNLSHPPILINACDPANLYGAASPLPILHPVDPQWRFLRHPGNYLVLAEGMPVLAVEGRGSRLTPLRDLSGNEKREALGLLPQLLEGSGRLRRIRALKVEYWDGQPVRSSEIVPYLKSLGFRDEYKAMTYHRQV
jgi:ATP-dependent Lhr-like helicase